MICCLIFFWCKSKICYCSTKQITTWNHILVFICFIVLHQTICQLKDTKIKNLNFWQIAAKKKDLQPKCLCCDFHFLFLKKKWFSFWVRRPQSGADYFWHLSCVQIFWMLNVITCSKCCLEWWSLIVWFCFVIYSRKL
jgi:hypothetical protein